MAGQPIFTHYYKGEFDIYAEYTGTIWEVILKKSGSYDESRFKILESQYRKKYQLEWANTFGFNNTSWFERFVGYCRKIQYQNL